MITPKLIILPLLAAALTFALTPVVRKLTKGIGAVDCPDNDRKCHSGNIPSSGGVAIFFGFLLASLFFNRFSPEVIGFFIGGTIITGIGLLDDVFDLPPITKFFGQVLAALVVIYSGVRVDFIANPSADGTVGLGFLSLPFTFFWIVGMANAINFIDGLDGLAAGISGIAAWTLGFVALVTGRYDAAVLAFTIGAASFAFLPHNFSEKRKIFMGDSGSNFLGYSLAVVSIMGIVKVAAAFTMLIPMLILAVPIFDTLFAIIRRLAKKQSPFTPDSAHLHHRIMNKGFSARQTTGIICGVSAILSIVAIFSTRLESSAAIGLFVGVSVFLLVVAWFTGIIKVTLSE